MSISSKRAVLSASAVSLVVSLSAGGSATAASNTPYRHVLLVSVDGLHGIDLSNILASAKGFPTLKLLGQHAVVYPNAFTSAPSDSFPGMVGQVTGGTPYSAGVFYDDSYDRTLYAPGSGCKGLPGTETNFAENIDYNSSLINAGGTLGQPLTQIDPKKLPMRLENGVCAPVYPHQFLRVNTMFEVIRAHGGYTAWADKHPAYDILNGPSGKGIIDLYTPEIDSDFVGGKPGESHTASYAATRQNDEMKVRAVLNEIDGRTANGNNAAPVPEIFGMNFQAVSVGQKLASSGPTDPAGLVGGYADANGTPNNALLAQAEYVDDALGRIVAHLRSRGLLDSTLLIVSAKHGQSPIDPSTRRTIDDTPFTLTPGYGFHIADDEAMIWLAPATRAKNLAGAGSYLTKNAQALGTEYLLDRNALKDVYRDPAVDARTPDFIDVSKHGVIYTTGTKLAEHGGFSFDDRNVALLVAGTRIAPSVDIASVQTTQIAPTILTALGLDPNDLQAVRIEHTAVLPGLK
ncbi:alkaline phosphatase family protein [Lichenicola cladoniae]|uniref:alkaline phosphatase family protein n=1 Tax=Lichenicola cladoniae TaxID=1484109 RepID=UPI0019534ED3|nr:alkaline phosphatase family protein [Lichenicola cladoniae]